MKYLDRELRGLGGKKNPHFCLAILEIFGKNWSGKCAKTLRWTPQIKFWNFWYYKVSLELTGTERSLWELKKMNYSFFFSFFPQLFSSIDPEFSCEPILIRGKQKFWQLYNLVLNHLPGKMWKQLGILWLWMDAFDAPYWNSGFLWALISQKPARKRNLTFSLWNIQVRKAGRWWGSHKNLL